VTPKKGWPERFLAALADDANVRAACRTAGISRKSAYQRRGQDPAFAAAWQDALADACDDLEREAVRRARDGTDEPVLYQGEPVGEWVNRAGRVVPEGTAGARWVPLTLKRYSDVLLIFLLKAHRPELYRESLKLLGGGQGGEIVIVRLGGGASMEDL